MDRIDLRELLPWHPEKRWTERSLGDITHIVVHHSATGENTNPMLTVRAFNRGHINTNGWPRIAYHYVIDSHGKIYWTNKHRHITTHAGNKNVNAHSIGVCLIGRLHVDDPTQAQLDSLKELRQFLGVPAIPHYQVTDTACPGKHWWVKQEKWVNEDKLPEPSEGNLLSLHFQIGLPGWAPDFFKLSGIRKAKLMDPGDEEPLAAEFPDMEWLIRFNEPEHVATAEVLKRKQGAYERLLRLSNDLRKRPWLSKPRFFLEHMNEPSNAHLLQTDEKRISLDIFTAEYTRLLYEQFGIRSCGYCLGVGHPEPQHVNQVFKCGLPALKKYQGRWALHEYNYPTVLTYNKEGQLTTHLTLRHRRIISALNRIGMPAGTLPDLELTEAGIDRLLTGIVGGWKQINNDPVQYVQQLAHYETECRKTRLVKGIYIFTATPERTWFSYGMDEADAMVLARYIATGDIRR